MKKTKIIYFSLGLVAGAVLCYAALWMQVAWNFQTTWCKVYTGDRSADQQQFCDRYGAK